MVEFKKGFLKEDGTFIAEGKDIKVTTLLGEVVSGKLIKVATKEFRLKIEEVVRVILVEDIQDVEEVVEDEDGEDY